MQKATKTPKKAKEEDANNMSPPKLKRKIGSSHKRRPSAKVGSTTKWTNTFSRSTIHWDPKQQLLDQEKKIVKKEPKPTKRCCGNSPGKTHTQNHRNDKLRESPDYRHSVYRMAQDRTYKPYLGSSAKKPRPSTAQKLRPASSKPMQNSPSKQKLNDEQIAEMAMQIAKVLTNPMKIDVMLTGSVNYQGKEMSMKNYLQMQSASSKTKRQR